MSNANPESSDLIVRLAGHGQFKVKKDTVHRLNSIDDKIVELLKSEITDSKTKEGQLQKNLNEIQLQKKVNHLMIRKLSILI